MSDLLTQTSTADFQMRVDQKINILSLEFNNLDFSEINKIKNGEAGYYYIVPYMALIKQ